MSEQTPATNNSGPKPWYMRIGPGLITACVVIGPGSVTTSSQIGAGNGYSMLWIVLVSVAFMMMFMSLGARLGAVAAEAPCDLIRRKSGKGLSIAVGIGVFFISAAFQSGNNIGVAAAFKAFVPDKYVVSTLIVLFNVLAISFLYVFKDMYKTLEKLMTVFVGLMLLSFAINLISLKPSIGDMLAGFIPSLPAAQEENDKAEGATGQTAEDNQASEEDTSAKGDATDARKADGQADQMLTLLGLVGTTFVITAAFYQAYLVRQKGWKAEDLKDGLLDARIGSIIMFLITMMLMATAAAAFHGKGEAVSLKDPVEIATALQSTFGAGAKVIFCLGLFSAAYSSFLVNSMIGGFMASDGLGLGSQPTDRGPRMMTTLALVTGMLVGVAVELFDFNRAPTIIAAQAVTVIAAPLVAAVLLWLTSSRDVMGDHINGRGTIVFGIVGLIMLVAMAGKVAFVDIPKKVDKYMNPEVAEVQADQPEQGDDSNESEDG